MIAQSILRRYTKVPERQAFTLNQLIDVVGQQLWHVLRILAQRRYLQRQHVKTGDEITAQCSCGYFRLVIWCNRSENVRINLDFIFASGAHVKPLLQRAQQQPLRLRTQVCEFIDIQGTAARLVQRALLYRPALFAAEQLRLGIAVGHGRRHQLDEFTARNGAHRMQESCKGAATGARLTDEQDRRIVARKATYLLADLLHDSASTDGNRNFRE